MPEPMCVRPGVKPRDGESPEGAVLRALLKQLAPLARHLELGLSSREVQSKESSRYRMPTKPLRLAQSAKIDESAPGMSDREAEPRRSVRARRSLSAMACSVP